MGTKSTIMLKEWPNKTQLHIYMDLVSGIYYIEDETYQKVILPNKKIAHMIAFMIDMKDTLNNMGVKFK